MKECGQFNCCRYDTEYPCNCDKYKEYAEDYDCFVEDGKFAEWIDVNKSLPEQKQPVLMWCSGYIFDGVYVDGIFFTPDGESRKPLAWMPRLKNPDFI